MVVRSALLEDVEPALDLVVRKPTVDVPRLRAAATCHIRVRPPKPARKQFRFFRSGMGRRGGSQDLSIGTDDGPIPSRAPQLEQPGSYGGVRRRSLADEVSSDGSESAAAGVARRRCIEEDLRGRARLAAVLLQQRDQFKLVVGCIQSQIRLGDEIVAVDQIGHRPILPAQAQESAAFTAKAGAVLPCAGVRIQWIDVTISKAGGCSRCFFTVQSRADCTIAWRYFSGKP